MKPFKPLLFFLLTFLAPLYALAQDVVETTTTTLAEVVPAVTVTVQPGLADIFAAVLDLIKNLGSLSPLAIASAVITILIMILNSSFCKGWFGKQSPFIKRLIIVVLGEALAIITSLIAGVPLATAAWAGLVVAGGAQLIFENVISLWPDARKLFEVVIKLLSFFKK